MNQPRTLDATSLDPRLQDPETVAFFLDLFGSIMEEAIGRIDAIDDLICSEGADRVDRETKAQCTSALAFAARSSLVDAVKHCQELLGRPIKPELNIAREHLDMVIAERRAGEAH